MAFILHPADIWPLDIDTSSERYRSLMFTPYEEICRRIVDAAQIKGPTSERGDRVAGERYSATICLPSVLVDLFHNGAGGYRAQYLENIERGRRANSMIIKALYPILLGANEIREHSLGHTDVKIWISEGSWRDKNEKALLVPHWVKSAGDKSKLRAGAFVPEHAYEVPEFETELTVKGGWLDLATHEPLPSNKSNGYANRSTDIADWGFT